MKDIKPGAAVGFVGLGKMGAPMATRLAVAGYQVQGYDVSEETARSWAERVGGSPAADLGAGRGGRRGHPYAARFGGGAPLLAGLLPGIAGHVDMAPPS